MTTALIFDLDGTLVDSEAAYREALATIGFDPGAQNYKSARQAVKERLGPGHVCARNRLLYFKELLESTGSYSPARLLNLMDKYERSLADAIQKQWKHLERDVLMRRLAAKYSLIVLTNENTRTQLIKLRAMDTDATIFSHVMTSEEIGCEKPNQKLIQAALQRLGAKAQDCMAIGDDLEADIQPAITADLRTVWTTEFVKKPDEKFNSSQIRPHFRISCLSELEAHLQWDQA